MKLGGFLFLQRESLNLSNIIQEFLEILLDFIKKRKGKDPDPNPNPDPLLAPFLSETTNPRELRRPTTSPPPPPGHRPPSAASGPRTNGVLDG